MSAAYQRLLDVYQSAQRIPFDDTSRFVFMSDCHRGDGSWADDFLKNQRLYFSALTHYYKENYTYIELGDGDELWENRKLSDILRVHSDSFWLLYQFFTEGRLYFIFGNHDRAKKDSQWIKNQTSAFTDNPKTDYLTIFRNSNIHEGLVLKHTITNHQIFLVHGHQADFFNDQWWKISRWLVRYIWKPLELVGIQDPTRTAENNLKKNSIDKKLTEWVTRENQMLIAGHTHRPVFPEIGNPPYFNDGCCVQPHYITGIEIVDGTIVLVEWSLKIRADGTETVARNVLAGPRKLMDYYSTI